MFLFGNRKKRELQRELDSILRSGKSKLEMTNEIQKLYLNDRNTFETLNVDLMQELLSDYILSDQWEKEKKEEVPKTLGIRIGALKRRL